MGPYFAPLVEQLTRGPMTPQPKLSNSAEARPPIYPNFGENYVRGPLVLFCMALPDFH
jgi:hypothetical protein